MSFGGGGSPAPKPVAAVEPPKVTDPAVQEAIEKEKALARRRKGRGSTLITGTQGLVGEEKAQKKTLLGE